MFSFTTPADGATDASAIARRLSGMPGYKELDMGSSKARVRVGHEVLMRMIGIYIYSDYTAPMKITVEKFNGDAHVTIKPPMWLMENAKTAKFYAKTNSRIQERITAHAQAA